MAEFLWFLAVAVAPFLVAAAIIYALLHRRRLTAREEVDRDAKTRELYDDRNGPG